MRIIRYIVLLVLVLIYCPTSYSQEAAYPFIRNYDAKEFKADEQTWAIAQDKGGRMFISSNSGILEYDASTWSLHEPKRETFFRDILVGKDGYLYCAGYDAFGRMMNDSVGGLYFHILSDLLPDSVRRFGDVWKVLEKDGAFFFFAENRIFRYEDGQITHQRVSLSTNFGFIIRNQLYIMVRNKGLFEIDDKNLKISETPLIANPNIHFILPIATGLLIYDKDEGFFCYNVEDRSLQRKKLPVEPFLLKHYLYDAIELGPDHYAFGTLQGGIVITNLAGDIMLLINENNGLKNNCVNSLYYDSQCLLWSASDDGFSKIELFTPLSYFDKRSGLEGYIVSMQRHNGDLYVGSMDGVFRMEKVAVETNSEMYRFKKLNKEHMSCFFLFRFPSEEDSKTYMLGTGSEGLLHIHDDIVEYVTQSGFGYCIGYTPKFPKTVFTGNALGLLLIYSIDNLNDKLVLISQGTIPEVKFNAREICTDKNENLWICTDFNGIYYLKFGERIEEYTIQLLNTTNGLPQNNYNYMYNINNKLLVATSTGIYKPTFSDREELVFDKFVRDEQLNVLISNNSMNISQIGIDENQTLWFTTKDGLGSIENQSTNTKWISRNGSALYRFFDDGEIIWCETSDGVLKVTKENTTSFTNGYSTCIRKVILNQDSTVYKGTWFQEGSPEIIPDSYLVPTLKQSENTITFQFSSNWYEAEEKTLYSYFLEGLEKDWSDWSTEQKARYTKLPEGIYHFRVKSKNIYGTEGKEASFTFTVLPPWYRTFFAYTILFLLGLVCLWMITKLYALRLKRKNEKLEQIVRDRTTEISEKNLILEQKTKEIVAQSEQLEMQNFELNQQKEEIMNINDQLFETNQELQEKNVQVLDSINYAKLIQEAIFPSRDMIKKYIDDFFIYFQPRDIVSGDFYWFSHIEGFSFFVVADCTGHSVPGAFMSMIGITLLNDIINKSKILQPALILNRMNQEVSEALKQNTADMLHQRDDGMTLTLCRIDTKNDEIIISSANQPYFLTKNSSTERYKGDLLSIGGNFMYFPQKISFSEQTFRISETDHICLLSDGYIDQFGGENYSKFLSERFLTMIQKIHTLDCSEQEVIVRQELIKWMETGIATGVPKGISQIDDIVVVGIVLKTG